MNETTIANSKQELNSQEDQKEKLTKQKLQNPLVTDYSKLTPEEKAKHYAQQISESAKRDGHNLYAVCDIPKDRLRSQDLILILKEFKTQNLENILNIKMVNMRITDDIMIEVCELKWLKSLIVPCNDISNDIIMLIPTKLPNLEALSISSNPRISNIQPLLQLENLKTLLANETRIKLKRKELKEWQKKLDNYDFEKTKTKGKVLKKISLVESSDPNTAKVQIQPDDPIVTKKKLVESSDPNAAKVQIQPDDPIVTKKKWYWKIFKCN